MEITIESIPEILCRLNLLIIHHLVFSGLK